MYESLDLVGNSAEVANIWVTGLRYDTTKNQDRSYIVHNHTVYKGWDPEGWKLVIYIKWKLGILKQLEVNKQKTLYADYLAFLGPIRHKCTIPIDFW